MSSGHFGCKILWAAISKTSCWLSVLCPGVSQCREAGGGLGSRRRIAGSNVTFPFGFCGALC